MSLVKLVNGAAPTTPPSGSGFLFPSAGDKELYWKKDDGTTTALGGGASTSTLSGKQTVRAGTTAALPANTYSAGVLTATANGALTAQDGVTLVVNERLLVKNEATGANNGIYVVTQVGDGSTPYILTRSTDADSSAKVTPNINFFISEGTTLADTFWSLTTNAAITLGTTALTFAKATGAISLTADVTGTLPIANGGTGQTTQTAAMDALSPTTTKGDLLVDNGTNVIRVAVGSNDQVLTADSTQASGVKWAAAGGAGSILKNWISGLILSNNVTDSANDIDISAGEAVDTTQTYLMTLSATLTKRLDATWAVGTNQGGLDTGAESSSTWYHVWLIRKDSDGSIDALFSLSASAPTMPAGYTAKRLIGSFYNNSTSDIRQFSAMETGGGGIHTSWVDSVVDVNVASTVTTTNTTFVALVPTGYNTLATLACRVVDATPQDIYISSMTNPQTLEVFRNFIASVNCSTTVRIMMNSSAQFRARSATNTIDSFVAVSISWEWGRR